MGGIMAQMNKIRTHIPRLLVVCANRRPYSLQTDAKRLVQRCKQLRDGIFWEREKGCVNWPGQTKIFSDFLIDSLHVLSDECVSSVSEESVRQVSVARISAKAYSAMPSNLRETMLDDVQKILESIICELEQSTVASVPTTVDNRVEKLDSQLQQLIPIVFDCESSGLSRRRDHVVEIAARNLQTGDEFSTLVRLPDGASMHPSAEEVTGITTESLQDSCLPSFESAICNFLEFLKQQQSNGSRDSRIVLVGHNIFAFDIPLLVNRMAELGNIQFPNDLLFMDTLGIAKNILPGLRSYKLTNIYETMAGQDAQVAHRAMADVELTSVVLKGLLLRIMQQSVRNRDSFSHVVKMSDAELYGVFFGNDMLCKSVMLKRPEDFSAVNQIRKDNQEDDRAENLSSSSNRFTGIFNQEDLAQLGKGMPDLDLLPGDHADKTQYKGMLEGRLKQGSSLITRMQVPIKELKGLFTKKELKNLDQMKIETVRDLLYCFPRRYLVSSVGSPPSPLTDEEQAILVPVYIEQKTINRGANWSMLRLGLRCLRMEDLEDMQKAMAAMHERPLLEYKVFRKGRSAAWTINKEHERYRNKPMVIYITSRVQRTANGTFTVKDQQLTELGASEFASLQQQSHYVRPIYPQKSGISSQFVQESVQKMLRYLEGISFGDQYHISDTMDQGSSILPLLEAIQGIHQPNDADLFVKSRTSLAFHELFVMQLKMLLRNPKSILGSNEPQNIDEDIQNAVIESLDFGLTSDQAKALRTINSLLRSTTPTASLLQGDVGCGKTIVAILSAFGMVGRNRQVAIMAPTEILAEQHMRSIQSVIQASHARRKTMADLPRVALLTGSTKMADRKEILSNISSGKIDIIVGTHALTSEQVNFCSLGLVIVDEQHKFGVEQRARLLSKAVPSPHVLNMSATPIPRSLALVMYGEMELISIREMPPGRIPVATFVLAESTETRSQIGMEIQKEINSGGKVFVVCPLIENNKVREKDLSSAEQAEEEEEEEEVRTVIEEKQRLSADIPPDTIGILHGRMTSDEKDRVVKQFLAGNISVLVCTTVVEVGVNVPEASLMVIEHSERFGLSTLHQLRGRVGRGCRPSKCLLITNSNPSNLNRLRVMEETSDGFQVAEADLKNRGSGDLAGRAQSGHSSLTNGNHIWELPRDSQTVLAARTAAEQFLSSYGYDVEKWPAFLQETLNDPSVVDLDVHELPNLQ